MTTGKDDLRDGFGHLVSEQIAASGSISVMYGVAPYDETPIEPYVPYVPPAVNPPFFPPNTTTTVSFGGQPDRFVLTVIGPKGTEFAVAMTAEQWAKVRAAVLEALR